MLRDAAITLIKQRMSNSQDSDLDAMILSEMRHAQEDVLERESDPYWFLFGKADVLVTANAVSVALTDSIYYPLIAGSLSAMEWTTGDPMDWFETSVYNGGHFLTRQENIPFYAYEATADASSKISLEENTYPYLWNLYGETISGTLPAAIARLPEGEDTYAIFSPTIADFYLQVYGFYSAMTLETNIENYWLKYAADLLIARTGQVIADQYIRYAKHADAFEKQELQARIRLQARDIEEKERHLQFIRGGAI